MKYKIIGVVGIWAITVIGMSITTGYESFAIMFIGIILAMSILMYEKGSKIWIMALGFIIGILVNYIIYSIIWVSLLLLELLSYVPH